MHFFFGFVGLISLVTLLSACQIHNNISEAKEEDSVVYYEYAEYDDYDIGVDEIRTSSTVISSRLILCANLNSIDNISTNYTYSEENYEQHLKVEKSNIPTIKQSAFSNFTTITKLFLSHVKIKTILPGAFNGLSKLKELHLSHNEIREITKGVYNSLHKLEILTLNDNKIHNIENMALTGLDNLHVLHLQRNNIKNTEDIFLHTPNVKYLDLSYNPLSVLFVGNLTKLEVLNLTGTSISQIDGMNFTSRVRVLNMSDTQLTQVDISLFSQIDILDLSVNKIKMLENCQVVNGSVKTVNIANFSMSHNLLESLRGSLFNGSLKLREIDFGFNTILTIDGSTFHGLYNLKSLLLNNNKICQISNGLFKDLTSLENLDLSSNWIIQLQFGVFNSLPNLQTLDFSNNRLTSLNDYAFQSMKNLRDLDLSNNFLTSWLGTHYGDLEYLGLDGNPWDCEHLARIISYYQESSKSNKIIAEGHSYDVENILGIACISEVNLTTTTTKIEGDENKQLRNFLNEGFLKTNFVQYFEHDYNRSKFFQMWQNYKFYDNVQRNDDSISDFNSKILIFISIIQLCILFMFVFGFYLVFRSVRKNKHHRLSEIELY